ncbi:MAG: T9SS type A sorting domain-containing protein [Sphingobacteriaceae bacterium]|nr:T9SS type A sorting domain-containing protein [Sphingobacteriaceae bacterium]
MIKNFFVVLSLCATTATVNAQNPTPLFQHTPKHPLLQQIKPILQSQLQNNVQLRAIDARPDSVHYSSWDTLTNAWQIEEVNALSYDANSRITRVVNYSGPGIGSFPISDMRYSYTPAGKLASYSFNLLLGGQVQEQMRLEFNYDANGRKASGVFSVVDPLTNSLMPLFGDSIAYVRNQNNEVIEATHYLYDNLFAGLGWVPIQRVTDVQSAPNGSPKAYLHWSWDDQMQDWSLPTRMQDVVWGFGWKGWETAFGTIQLDETFNVYEPSDFSYTEPTDYLSYLYIQNQWEPSTLAKSASNSAGEILSIQTMRFDALTRVWEDMNLSTFGYANGEMEDMTTFYFDFLTMNYEPISRLQYRFDNQFGFMNARRESWYDGTTWIPTLQNRFAYQHNNDGKPTLCIGTEAVGAGAPFVNVFKKDFFYKTPVAASVKPNTYDRIAMRIYPNPAQNELHIQTAEADVQRILIRNMQGQVVKQQSVNQEHAEVLVMNISELAAGIYVVEAIGRNNKGVERLIKH